MKLSELITAAGGVYELAAVTGMDINEIEEISDKDAVVRDGRLMILDTGEEATAINSAGLFTVKYETVGDVSWLPGSVGNVSKPFMTTIKEQREFHPTLHLALKHLKAHD